MIFIAFLGIFSAILLPIKTFSPIAVASAEITPINMTSGTKYLAANKPDAICVLSPNSLSRTAKNDVAKGVLLKISFPSFFGSLKNFSNFLGTKNL